MECPNCKLKLKKVKITVYGAESKAISYQCLECNYFETEQKSATKVMNELNETCLN